MMIFSAIGWFLLLAAAGLVIQAWAADQRMQRFRVHDQPAAAYLFIPIRWQKRLYTPDAHRLVTQAWRSMAAMYGCGFLGLVMLGIGGAL